MGGSRVRDFWESGGFFSSLVDSIVLGVTDMTRYSDEDDWWLNCGKGLEDYVDALCGEGGRFGVPYGLEGGEGIGQ